MCNSFAVKIPSTNNEPVIDVLVLICKPSKSIDAVLLPLLIKFNFNPVTPDAGMFIKFEPSP